MKLDELSLVDSPANKASKISIVKRLGEDDMDKRTHTGDMSETEKRRFEELKRQGMSETDAREKVMAERANKGADPSGGSGGDVSTGTGTAENTQKVDDLQKQVDSLTSQLQSLESQLQTHGLSVSKKDDGTVQISKASEDETIEGPNGTTIYKSQVGPGAFEMMKAQNEELRKMRERQEQEDLRKRADSEIPNLKGTADERGALLKAVDNIADETIRNKVKETIKAADGAAKHAFAEVGKSLEDDESSATARLNKMAQDHAKDNNMPFEAAFAEVSKAGEGKRLFDESRREKRQGN
jgi:polyhydroxyalkanoate synthesis regulator phasin